MVKLTTALASGTQTKRSLGSISYFKRPGAVLNAGTLIARLVLDDPDSVALATPFTGTFPTPALTTEKKLHQTFKEVAVPFLDGMRHKQGRS